MISLYKKTLGSYIYHNTPDELRNYVRKNPAEIIETNENGITWLMHAVASASPEAAEILLAAGADPNIQSKGGRTALLLAVKCIMMQGYNSDFNTITNFKKIIKLLLNAGANPNLANDERGTALHYARIINSKEIIADLINAGADPKIKNNFGEDAFTICRDPEHLSICIENKRQMDEVKKNFSSNVIANIGLKNSEFRLAYGKYGQKIITYNLMLGQKGKEHTLSKIRSEDPGLLDYLTIRDHDDLKKLSEYILTI